MTVNRNIDSDQHETARVLQLVGRGNNGDTYAPPNWLGHTLGSAKLDRALINGATMKELKAIRGAIEEHFLHLREEHGLEIHKDIDDVYRIVVPKN
jgi:hypothetical protein